MWGIVGGVVALIISGGSVLALISSASSYTYNYGSSFPSLAIGSIVGIFAGMIIGSLVAAIGNYATIVKIVLESVEETGNSPT